MKQGEFCNLLEQIADRLDVCFSEVGALDTDKLSDVLSSEQLKTVLTWLRHYNYPHDAVELKQRIEKITGWFERLNKMSYDAFLSKNRMSKDLPLPDSRKKDLLSNAFFLKDLVDKNLFNDIPEMAGELRRVATLLKEDQKPANTQKAKGKKIMITMGTSKEIWGAIKNEYDVSKKDFGRKINFVSDQFKRKIIFRDVEHAFVLASQGFSKPAVILAGGVIEELLKLYLKHKNIKPKSKRFVGYIQTCEDKSLLKRGVSRLSDSIRDFRNLVHLDNEKAIRHTISKPTAKGAVSSIFTIANDFQ